MTKTRKLFSELSGALENSDLGFIQDFEIRDSDLTKYFHTINTYRV